MTSKYIDMLIDKELTMKNAKKIYSSVYNYCDAVSNCDECIFNVCIIEELAKLYNNYLGSLAKLFGIEYNKPFKVRHIAHVRKEVRESLEQLEFILYEDEGIMVGSNNFDELLDYLLNGTFTVVKD